MSDAENKMKFQKSYFTAEQMNKGGKGVFSSQFSSYITDGEAALKDKIYQTDMQKNRSDVMRDIRSGLRQRMKENNDRSFLAAKELMKEHKSLREQMQAALQKAKEATRVKKLLSAKLLAEKSSQSNEKAENSENLLSEMVDEATDELSVDKKLLKRKQDRESGIEPDSNAEVLKRTEDDVSLTDVRQRNADLNYLKGLRDVAEQNKNVVHKKRFISLFRAISKKITRSAIGDAIEDQEKVIREQQMVLRDKTRAWNEKRRRDYESGSFRQYYDDYDRAAASYRALNRNNSDVAIVPKKSITEYVGEFDIQKLDSTLAKLEANPYLNADVEIKNKKDGKGITDEELLKSHRKITLLSETDENGRQIRYKLNDDFQGYMAARQLKPGDPTALTDRRKVVSKKLSKAEDFAIKLKVDERDIEGRFINSEDNVEIIQAKTRFLLTGQKVNGVFLNGEFLSADRRIIKGNKDSYTIGAFNTWGYTKQKEKVRKAVLKADIFRLINAKTIQAAAGYEASQSTGAEKIKEELQKEIEEAVLKDGELKNLMMGKLEPDQVKEKLKDAFSKEHDRNLLESGTELPNEAEAKWEEILLGNDLEAKKKLPQAAILKVIYDVIRQETVMDSKVLSKIRDRDSRFGRMISIIPGLEQQGVMKLALLLLSDDEHPVYWDVAKEICTRYLPVTSGIKINEQKDSDTFKRALKYGRAENGQLMRMALIDELNTKRKNFDLTDIFGAMMPTKWKQYTEDLAAQRGFGAIMKQKAADGTFLKFVGDVFDSVTTVGKDLKLFDKTTKAHMMLANTYVMAVTSCLNVGAITQSAAMGYGELFGDETYYKEVDGKQKEFHTRDDRRWTIGLVFSMVRNLGILVKAITKWRDKRKKEIDRKAKNEPNYDPKPDLSFTQNKYYEIVFSLASLAATMGVQCAQYAGNTPAKNVCNAVKHTLALIENSIGATQAGLQAGRIDNAEKDFETLMTKPQKSEEEAQMVDVLKQNSQLQYGMSLAKRKSKDEKSMKALKAVKSAGKGAISLTKAVSPGIGDVFPPFVIADASWTLLTTIAEVGMEVHQQNSNVKFNIGKMLGEKYKGVNKKLISKVLKREAGISSVDYLPDLARIFMSINTHVFMQTADTQAEKKVGSKIATTLLNNKNYTEDKLKKVKVKDLMSAMGVKGNFKKILKYSLA